MSQTDFSLGKRQELVSVANSMLSKEINLIEGIRKICSLRFSVGDSDNEVFLPIRGIDSETDSFPVGKTRENWGVEYLRQKDLEMEVYLKDAQNDIFLACQEIIKEFSKSRSD